MPTLAHVKASSQVRRIDRRLKACHNPLLDPSSAAFQAEEAAREQAAAAARQRKARAPGSWLMGFE